MGVVSVVVIPVCNVRAVRDVPLWIHPDDPVHMISLIIIVVTATPGRPPMTDTDSRTSGRSARKQRPRSSFGEWSAAAGRPDPVEVLQEQAQGRVESLLPIRYGRMAASPFAFYRGAAAVMAWDLAQDQSTGLRVQLCGDAHLSNLGGFAAPDRQMVFDLNDFDETLPGPFEWDVQRLGASFEIAARSLGLPEAKRSSIVARSASSYRRAMAQFATMTDLDLWAVRLDGAALEEWVGAEAKASILAQLQKALAKAKTKDRFKALSRLTRPVDGDIRFVSDPPLLVPAHEVFGELGGDELDTAIQQLLGGYTSTVSYRSQQLLERYTYRHTARKVVGVGSVGTRCWVVLLTGRTDADPLFIQVKQASQSVLEPYAGASEYPNHGQRVVYGQSLMQAAADPFLGWLGFEGPEGYHEFYLRQLWDWKASVDVASMTPTGLGIYAEICGWTLARAHACTGDRDALTGYLGSSTTFDTALASYASAYADQNERDHAGLVAAIADGRVEAVSGI